MTDVAALTDELTHVGHVIAVTERTAKHAEDPFPWELSLQGLRARRSELVEELGRVLGADDAAIRQAVVRALGRLGGEEVVPMLASAAQDPAPRVRQAAIWALAEIETEGAAAAIADVFVLGDEETQWIAFFALMRLGACRDALALAQRLDDAQPHSRALRELALSLAAPEETE